jgi:hypothetical protein
LLVERQDDPPLGLAAGPAGPADGIEQLRRVQRRDVVLPAPVAAVADQHAPDREIDPLDQRGRRHEVTQRAFPNAVLELGLDVTGQGRVMEADAAAKYADQGVRRLQPGARERGERGALGVVLLDLLGQRLGGALRRDLGRFDDQHLTVLAEQGRHPRPDPIRGFILVGVALPCSVLATQHQRADRIGGPQRVMLPGRRPHVDFTVQRPPLT